MVGRDATSRRLGPTRELRKEERSIVLELD